MANLDKSVYYVYLDKNGSVLTGDTGIILSNLGADEFDFEVFSFPEITFTPDPTSQQTVVVSINVANTLDVGKYTIAGSATSTLDVLTFTIELTVTDSGSPTDDEVDTIPFELLPVNAYEVKYRALNNGFTLDISEYNYSGGITPITADITHNYANREDLIQPIVASNLSIVIDADSDLSMSDLYSEDERNFLVHLYKASQLVFYGFLKPDGIVEDWVSDKYQVSVDAMDGLSTLKSLTFLRDDGVPFDREMTQLDVVYYALRRIGYNLPINIQNTLPKYTGLSTTESVLKHVTVNTERYYQDLEKKEAMDCEKVLTSILDIYNATVIQRNGEWWIFRANDISDTMTFHRYVPTYEIPTYLGDTSITTGLSLGSQIDNYFPHHASANQSKSIYPTIQSISVKYEYGTVSSLYVNPNIETTSGLNADGWTINSLGGAVKRNPTGRGIMITSTLDNGTEQVVISNNDPIPVLQGDSLELFFRYHQPAPNYQIIHYRVETPNYVLSMLNGWVAKPSTDYIDFEIKFGDKEVDHTIQVADIPENGGLTVTWSAWRIIAGISGYNFYIDEFSIRPASDGKLKGLLYNAQRTSRKSSVIKNEKTVYNGDSVSLSYFGTMRKDNGDPTTTWNRFGVTESKEILAIMADDNLRIAPRPMVVFEGDVFGWYDYLSRVTINNISGQFQSRQYSYNVGANINRAVFLEYATDMLTDVHTQKQELRDNEVKVKINS